MTLHSETNWLIRLRTVIYSVSIIVYLLSEVLGFNQLDLVLSFCAIISILISLPQSGLIASVLSVIFLIGGIFILWQHELEALTYLTSFGEMFNLLALFSIIPLIAVPIRIGGYSETVRHILESKIKSSSQLYRMILFYSYFLSCFMNLATLPMMYYSVKNTVEQFPLKNSDRFMASAITQGFSIPILWTPVAPIVGVVIDMTHVSWLSMFPLLFLLSIVGLLLDWGLYQLNRKRFEKIIEPKQLNTVTNPEIATSLEQADPDDWKPKLRQMSLAILVFIVLIATLDQLFPIGLIVSVIILTIPFSLVWSLAIKQGSSFIKETRTHFQKQLPKMSDQFAIFLTAGFFVSAVQISGQNETVNRWVIDLNHLIGPHTFVAILPLIPLLLAFLGMHPALAISLLANSLDPATLGISAEQLALALLGGAVSTFLMGPFNATSGIMASIVKVSPFRIVSWNAGYCMVFLLMIAVTLLWI